MGLTFDSYIRNKFHKIIGKLIRSWKFCWLSCYLRALDLRLVTECFVFLPITWMITRYQITHHSWNSRKHAKKFSEIRMRVRLYSMYSSTDSMNDYAIPDNISFFKFAIFLETGLHILGVMPKNCWQLQ